MSEPAVPSKEGPNDKTISKQMQTQLLAYVQSPHGLGLTNIKTKEQLDALDLLCLHHESVEDLFYKVGALFNIHCKKGGKPYASSTIGQWLSSLLYYVKDHQYTKDFLGPMITVNNYLVPTWLPACRGKIERHYNAKYLLNGNADYDDNDCCPAIYQLELSNHLTVFFKARLGVNTYETFKSDIEKAVIVVMQRSSVGRAGEVRNDKWGGHGGAKWDCYFKTLIFDHHETKFIKSYPITAVPHAYDPFTCIFFLLGAFAV
jgi:hypothetical protein